MVLKVDSDYKNNIKHYKPSLMLYLYEKKAAIFPAKLFKLHSSSTLSVL